jgi:outer membrane protein OmpA-like peptidoglycan-associated protein
MRSVGNAVMVLAKPPSLRSSPRRGARRTACRLAILAAVLGLGACNPVETWRDWTGTSKNDPDPETTPNSRNLAAGEASDYPNLATVPPAPNRALTAAEREKLTQSLIADRANAKYSDEKLRAGFAGVAAPAPPPPPPPVPEPTDVAPAPPAAGVAPSASAPAPPAAAPTSASGGAPAPSGPDAAAASATTADKSAAAPPRGVRKSGEPPEPPPMESSLEVPQVRSTPRPEQVQSASPPPYPTPAPVAANAPPAAPHLQSPPAPTPLPAAIGSAAYEAPPPLPVLAPLANSGKGGQQTPAPVLGTPIAEIKFAADSTSLTDEDRRTIQNVVPLYQQNPGKLRIVGYAGAGSGAVEQLSSFRTALDRAQAVAAAFTQAGIPADKIAVEAAPSDASSVQSRAEVLLER